MDLNMRPIPGTTMYLPPEVVDEMCVGVRRVLESGRLILGPETEQFERTCAQIMNVSHAVAVSSGTAALEIIFRTLGVAGRSVVIPANTFYATAVAVIRAGGTPVLADIAGNMQLDEQTLEAAWRDDTVGAVIVHIGGMMSGALEAVQRFVRGRNGFLVEDSAQGLGSVCPAGNAGAVGVAGATSFYPTKIVTAVEGGIVSTHDDDIAVRTTMMRDQGKKSFSENIHVEDGYSWRLSELHAVVGVSHARALDAVIKERRRVAAIYDEQLADTEIATIAEPPGHRWNRYKYVAILPSGTTRSDVQSRLSERGVGLSGEVFVRPLHAQPVFADRFGDARYPVAERLCAQHVCLPTSPEITDDDAVRVARTLREAVRTSPR
ncbi:MAG: DegT/DnrJ/EryC1/StrS family aminotransferase [Actinomycetota bacterium]